DVVGNSPVEVDVTDAVGADRRCELAVRITDPGGNFDWRDSSAMRWGKYALPMSHGFGGITGKVRIVVCDPVYLDDVYVQNTPASSGTSLVASVRDQTAAERKRTVAVRVFAKTDSNRTVARVALADIEIPPGSTDRTIKLSAPGAARWNPENPNLYVSEVELL